MNQKNFILLLKSTISNLFLKKELTFLFQTKSTKMLRCTINKRYFYKVNPLPKTWSSRSEFGAPKGSSYPLTLPFSNHTYTPAQLAAWQSLPYNLSFFAKTDEHKNNTSKGYDGEKVFLPKRIDKDKKKKITLALDIDETLAYIRRSGDESKPYFTIWGDNYYITERPGARDFLRQMNELFEIIVFTNAINAYATEVMKHYDPDNKFGDEFHQKRLLHRSHVRDGRQKDLFATGRPLDNILLIDNRSYTFEDQPRNSIHVPDFDGDSKDTCLIDIIPMM